MRFTNKEMARVMQAAGIKIGDTYELVFGKTGETVQLMLGQRGVHVTLSGTPPDSRTFNAALCIWTLSEYGLKHNLGQFSYPTPWSEIEQTGPLMQRMNDPIYNDMPVDELIARMEAEFRNFWSGFKPGGVLVAA